MPCLKLKSVVPQVLETGCKPVLLKHRQECSSQKCVNLFVDAKSKINFLFWLKFLID